MPVILQHILGICLLVAVFLVTKYFQARKMKNVAAKIINDLMSQGANNPERAVSLPYAKTQWLKIGLRDYRPKVLKSMVDAGFIGLTQDGRYFLLRSPGWEKEASGQEQ